MQRRSIGEPLSLDGTKKLGETLRENERLSRGNWWGRAERFDVGVNSACGDLVGEKRIAIFAPEMSSLLLSFVKRWAGLAGYISLART